MSQNSGPVGWLDDYFLRLVQDASNNILSAQPITQYTGTGVSVAPDPNNKRNVVTITAGIPKFNIVRVNSNGSGGAQASPYTAKVYDLVVMDTSISSVTVNLPTLASGEWVGTVHDQNTSLSTSQVTIVAPAGGKIALPPPNNMPGGSGPFAASYTYGGVSSGGEMARGTSLKYTNGGSGGGYILAQ